jgi:uncharacterized protein YecE (DUF72 family)
MVVEFRSASWWTERIAIPPRLRARAGPVKVVVDRPQRFGTNVPAVVASDLARLGDRAPARPQRRHLGQKGLTASSQRFNYDYSEAELGEIANSVATLAREVPVTTDCVAWRAHSCLSCG